MDLEFAWNETSPQPVKSLIFSSNFFVKWVNVTNSMNQELYAESCNDLWPRQTQLGKWLEAERIVQCIDRRRLKKDV